MIAPDIAIVTSLRAQLWDVGFRPVPVFNADADVVSPGKQPLGAKWQIAAQKNPPFCATSPAVAWALNTGIWCQGLRAIDIDIDDPIIASRCRDLVIEHLGESPIRFRRDSPRCLLLYRAAVGEPGKLTLPGKLGKIEVLGTGQQFVAFGLHPSGAELQWTPLAPGEERLEELTAVTEDAVLAVLTACAAIIEAEPPKRPSNGHDHPHAASDPQADPLRVAAALAAIPNQGPADWEHWNKVGMAVWRATGGSSAGWEAWNAWSARNASYDTAAARGRWEHYFTSPPAAIGAGSIFHLAAEAEQRAKPNGAGAPPEPPEGKAEAEGESKPEAPDAHDDPPANTVQPDLFVMKADLPLVSQRLRDRLARHQWVFERGGPARLTCYPPEENRPAEIHLLGVEGTIHAAHEVCRPYRVDHRGKRTNITLPEPVAKLYLALNGRWHLRPLHGICGSVLLEDDGSIHAYEGYHAPSGLWCTQAPPLTVPDRPFKDQAVDALYRLRATMRTFTFKGSLLTRIDGIDADVVDIEQKPGLCESAALCGLLTAVCRASLPLAPGVMINTPSVSGSGAGKGLLARMIIAIAFGIIAKAGTAGHDEQELEKRIGASLLRGEPVLLLDNLNNTLLRSAQLESCLTEPLVSVRLFGVLKMQDVRATAFVTVTGNGLQASGDTARRFIYPTLEPPVDNPEQREYPAGFLDGILARRSELLSDCLTIWRWGRQQSHLKRGLPFGSYERWTTWVRDPLLALGCDDPVKGVQDARDRDPHRVNITALFAEWRVWHGSDWMKADDLNPAVRRLIDDRERTAAIRQKLSPLVNTRLGGFMLEARIEGNAATTVSLYRVIEIGNG